MSSETGLRVLLVERDDDFRYVFALLLGLVGYRVETASNAAEAVASIKVFSPDVVLTELGLEHVGGLELARQIRRLPLAGDIVLVALTAYVQKHSEAEASEAGFDYFVAKPVSVERIVAIFESAEVMKKRRQSRWYH